MMLLAIINMKINHYLTIKKINDNPWLFIDIVWSYDILCPN